MITVVNKKTFKAPPGCCTIYIGRPSPLGNPFPMHNESERPGVIVQYRTHLRDKVAKEDPVIMKELEVIAAFALRVDVYLICWCAPKACHGDVIKEIVEERLSIELSFTPKQPDTFQAEWDTFVEGIRKDSLEYPGRTYVLVSTAHNAKLKLKNGEHIS